MKAKDATRAAMLIRAHGEFSKQVELLHDQPYKSYQQRGLEIQVCDFSDGEEGTIHAPHIKLDNDTARVVIPKIVAIIEDQLSFIGVSLDE